MKSAKRLWCCVLLYGLVHLASAAQPGIPALKITTPNGRESVLIGSVHIGLAGLPHPHPDVFANVQTYVIEQVLGEGPRPKPRKLWQPAIEHKAATGKTKWAPWADTLTQAELAELRRRIVCNGTPFGKEREMLDALLVSESPLTASEVAIRRCAPMAHRSRDEVLAGYARTRGVPFRSLETYAEVEGRRQNVPDHIHLHFLRVAMTDRQQQALDAMVRILNEGRYDEIPDVLNGLANSPADAALYDRLMIADRNEAWMPRLREYLEKGNAFINVGAAHIAGPKGLITLLRSAGMKVEPISLPAASDPN